MGWTQLLPAPPPSFELKVVKEEGCLHKVERVAKIGGYSCSSGESGKKWVGGEKSSG